MPRHRLGYVNRTALSDKEQSMASQDAISPDIADLNQDPPEQLPIKPVDLPCPPMALQHSASHGYDMYPQQFVRLIGCHDASLEVLRKRQAEKAH
jgi:hypothetical protein